MIGMAQHVTQHKRFVPCGSNPNSCFAKACCTRGTSNQMATEMPVKQKWRIALPSSGSGAEYFTFIISIALFSN